VKDGTPKSLFTVSEPKGKNVNGVLVASLKKKKKFLQYASFQLAKSLRMQFHWGLEAFSG
jgi:hypothetical protein